MKRSAVAILGVVVVAAAIGLALGLSGGSGGGNPASRGTTPSVPSSSRVQQPGNAKTGTQLGVDIWWRNSRTMDTPAHTARESQNIVRYVVSVLHANAVSLCFPIYTPTLTSDSVFTTSATPSTAEVGTFVRTAEKAHLAVSFRPLLNVGASGYEFRGHMHPANLNTFFASYVNAIRPYLRLAQNSHLATFVYASELWDLSINRATVAAWSSFVSGMKRYYHGSLEYDSSGKPWYTGQVVVPGFSDYADAYFPVAGAGPSTSEQTLYSAWTQLLSPLPASELHRTVLQEVGFAAIPTGYQRPSTVISGHTNVKYLPMEGQWFDMVCNVVRHFHLAGVYFWTIYFNSDPFIHVPQGQMDPTTWVGRPGASAIASCFESLGG